MRNTLIGFIFASVAILAIAPSANTQQAPPPAQTLVTLYGQFPDIEPHEWPDGTVVIQDTMDAMFTTLCLPDAVGSGRQIWIVKAMGAGVIKIDPMGQMLLHNGFDGTPIYLTPAATYSLVYLIDTGPGSWGIGSTAPIESVAAMEWEGQP